MCFLHQSNPLLVCSSHCKGVLTIGNHQRRVAAIFLATISSSNLGNDQLTIGQSISDRTNLELQKKMGFPWLIFAFLWRGAFLKVQAKNGNTEELVAYYSFDKKDFKIEACEKRAIVYENHVDAKDLESHFGGFLGLVHTQSWEIAFMTTLEKKNALQQIT